MPSKIRDNSPERRREKKDLTKASDKSDRDRKDKDRDRDRDRQRTRRHKTPTHRISSSKDKTSSRTSLSPSSATRRPSMPAVLDDAPLPLRAESKTSLPYPTFSKEHSRESVAPPPPQTGPNVLTPPTTDVGASKDKPSAAAARPSSSSPSPPSPPLTAQTSTPTKSRPSTGKPVSVHTIPEDDARSTIRDPKVRISLRPQSSRSNGHLRTASELGPGTQSPAKSRDKTPTRDSPLKPASPAQYLSQHRSVSQPTRLASPATTTTSSTADSGTHLSSDATSIAPDQPTVQKPSFHPPPAPVPTDVYSQFHPRDNTPFEVFIEEESPSLLGSTPGPDGMLSTPGPPPPPPPPVPLTVPKVDYLLQHGGLHQPVPKNLLLAGKPMAIQQAQIPGQQPIVVANLFEPYTSLLDSFDHVISKNGSLAVATGYRSVARRLLDRLEAVFARDISSEYCACPLCRSAPDRVDDTPSVSWGEVLEFVSGRRDLPSWPPFTFSQSPVGLGIALEFHVPMQRLDIDVPEEYREHYIRQSRKTKQSVDKWLNRQQPGDAPTSPPEEVDEETLTFAILTHLPPDQRPAFKDLLGIVDKPVQPPKRVPTPELHAGITPPAPVPTPAPVARAIPEHIQVTALAIQRLYRLGTPPRECESALFLLHNPSLHNTLATLAAISNDEWDILISGRFDGFLRSGADETIPIPDSRNATPFRSGARGATPSVHGGPRSRQGSYNQSTLPPQCGAPIAFDEETELATLAEIERDIYSGMEALEDAFETLHNKAEKVRQALRERSAGLAAAAQRRRGNQEDIEVRMGTPATANGGSTSTLNGYLNGRWDAETDDGLGDWDNVSDIQPDDSASNISSSRRRRPKRRTERRTPALIEEEDELEEESEGTQSPRKSRHR
ncbi:hypothetical protein PV10_02745 [Exophiala mesophila]|uniref:5-Methylcytosine G/T mismatch-specific DNA glycosylase n=1 Tax=Exophiala mesophila TaxID=212818 RepID=A0A0D1ZM81_EXOME|nr:uncharacterized protein PV10_02745 [Exophiala mesophila]KIV95039.1 hypothetical protein PV10_02745 [Exophiala mesophila]